MEKILLYLSLSFAVGLTGSLLYRLSVDECLVYHSPEYQCRTWAVIQEPVSHQLYLSSLRFECPCSILQILRDSRYAFKYVYQDAACFVQRFGLFLQSIHSLVSDSIIHSTDGNVFPVEQFLLFCQCIHL